MKKIYIKVIMFIILICIVFIGIVILTKHNVYSHVKELEEYEDYVIRQYSTNSILSDTKQRDEVLNLVEKYIYSNKDSLKILFYERNSSSIVVTFKLGHTHVFYPLVEGYY